MILQRSGKVRNTYQLQQSTISMRRSPGHSRSPSQGQGIIKRKKIKTHRKDAKIECYPFFEYFISLLLMVFCLYAMASLAPIKWGLPGFSKRQWWHFVVVFIVFAFSLAILFNSDCEILYIMNSRGVVVHEVSKFFCVFRSIEQKKISSISSIKIIASGGASKVSLHSRWYGNEIAFTDCSKVVALRCISEQNAERYKTMILAAIGEPIAHTRNLE